jgi:hypothetical protein
MLRFLEAIIGLPIFFLEKPKIRILSRAKIIRVYGILYSKLIRFELQQIFKLCRSLIKRFWLEKQFA